MRLFTAKTIKITKKPILTACFMVLVLANCVLILLFKQS